MNRLLFILLFLILITAVFIVPESIIKEYSDYRCSVCGGKKTVITYMIVPGLLIPEFTFKRSLYAEKPAENGDHDWKGPFSTKITGRMVLSARLRYLIAGITFLIIILLAGMILIYRLSRSEALIQMLGSSLFGTSLKMVIILAVLSGFGLLLGFMLKSLTTTASDSSGNGLMRLFKRFSGTGRRNDLKRFLEKYDIKGLENYIPKGSGSYISELKKQDEELSKFYETGPK